MSRRLGVLAIAIAAVVAAAPSYATPAPAAAVDIIESQQPNGFPEAEGAGFQAGTCTIDPCSAKTPERFFTQAAGHPPAAFTQIIAKHPNEPGERPIPVGNLKTILVDLPVGLSVNPQSIPQCQLQGGRIPPGGCPANTQVGVNNIVLIGEGSASAEGALPVYNLPPRPGEPARFASQLPLELGDIFLNGAIAWESDFHEYFTIHAPVLDGLRILKVRLVLDGRTGQQTAAGALLTNPSTCDNPAVEPFKRQYTSTLHADSEEEQVPGNDYDLLNPQPPSLAFLAGSQEVLSPLPKGAKPEGCANIPFKPSVSATPDSTQTDSPTGATIAVKVPFEPAAPIYQSNLRVARVTLPAGMGINPSAANALAACGDEQFGKGSRRAVACPAASKIGTVSIDTPPLPAGSLNGDVYLGRQLSSNPSSGDQYRIFLNAESTKLGVAVRLIANIEADPRTGQLTAVVREAPQLPFKTVEIKFAGGQFAPLTSPSTCGLHVTTHAMTAWSGTPDGGPADKGFALATAPGGGPCAKTLAERPFAPTFSGGPAGTAAHAFAPFAFQIARGDGQQELKGLDLSLPPGSIAKLAGIPYCPAEAIAAAAARSGAAEKASPSCPQQSQVGVASVAAGSGSAPLRIDGKVYLAGPYAGAPLSLLVLTPALAGPFDLGTVAVRAALFLDPETAQIRAVTDPIPDVFGGAKLDVRSISVNLDRPDFTLNGTSCAAQATAAQLRGGGADPGNPAAFSSAAVSVPFQATDCKKLAFAPKLKLRLSGAKLRAQHPTLRAVLTARAKDAGVARASVALPHALFLDQASLAGVCTRANFAAQTCPKRSVYGRARAYSPLLDKPLEGPIFLRSSSNPLPDLVAHLQGQVTIDLVGRIDSFQGGIRTTFSRVPDVPLTKFSLSLPGGKRGLLVASDNLCRQPIKAIVQLKAHNGKQANQRSTLKVPCSKKSARKGR
jgi:hypothetical protein